MQIFRQHVALGGGRNILGRRASPQSMSIVMKKLLSEGSLL